MRIAKVCLIVIPFILSMTAWSDESSRWELTGGPGLTLNTHLNNGGSLYDLELGPAGGLNAEVGYVILPPAIEAVMSAQWTHLFASSFAPSEDIASLYGGLEYNFFSEDVANSFFAEALVGVEIDSISDSAVGGYTSAALSSRFGMGKRFRINQHVTYRPEVDFYTTGCRLSITPVAFSLFF